MNKHLAHAIKLFTGRVARNIYLWAYIIISNVSSYARGEMIFRVYLYLLVIALIYFNNLLLVPRLLARRKFLAYLGCILSVTLVTSVIYLFSFRVVLHYFPSTAVNNINIGVILFSVITPDLSTLPFLSQVRVVFVTLLSIVLLFTVAWYIMDYSRQQKAAEEALKKQQEVELRFLKTQINPHFLFNTLNNLYGLALANSANAPTAILQLSSILRYLLYESNVPLVLFEKEKEIMLAYINLELLRLSKRESVKFEIAADAPYNIPPLLWVPILENVFKHGSRFLNDDYDITYSFTVKESVLTIDAKNTYNKSGKTEQKNGIGFANLKQRLDILYPGKYKMDTRYDENYYFTNLTIHLK